MFASAYKADLIGLRSDVPRRDGNANAILTSSSSSPKKKGTLLKAKFSCGHHKSIVRFVNGNIKRRECRLYVPHVHKNEECQCGRPAGWHDKAALVSLDTGNVAGTTWAVDTHTRLVPCLSFGTISFRGYGHMALMESPYARLDVNTEMDVVVDLLQNQWHMPKPKLIISITGGHRRFFMKNRLKTSFKRGIINAATTTDAWLLTGGTNTGVMKLVGDALEEYNLTMGSARKDLVALGVAAWGCVDNDACLTGSDDMGLFPAKYHADKVCGRSAMDALDDNHSHFLLVDDGTRGIHGADIGFRTQLQDHLSVAFAIEGRNVPVVMLVLEGGTIAMETAAKAIEQGDPVVAVQGTGRAADFIAYAYTQTRCLEHDCTDGSELQLPVGFDKELEDKALEIIFKKCAKDNEKEIDACVQHCLTLLKKRHLITVFHLDDAERTDEIDEAILYALCRGDKYDKKSQLNLAMAWDRGDVARNEIFAPENRPLWQNIQLDDFMSRALVNHQADFVQLFMDNGLDLHRFLTIRRLRDLYVETLMDLTGGPAVELINHLLQQLAPGSHGCGPLCNQLSWEEDSPRLLYYIGLVVSSLSFGMQRNVYGDEKYIVTDDTDVGIDNPSYEFPVGDPLSSRTPRYHTGRKEGCTLTSCDRQSAAERFKYPERALLIWAILFNRTEMATVFWKQGLDQIGGALFASDLLKGLAKAADKDEEVELGNELVTAAGEFEKIATGVLGECYRRDKTLAHRLLTRELEVWGGDTVLQISNNAGLMTFMGHSCCQTRLSTIWKGKMALHTPIWKIWLGLVFPLMVIFINFTAAKPPPRRNKTEPSDGKYYHENGTDERPEAGDQGHDGDHCQVRELKARRRKKGVLGRDDSLNLLVALVYFYQSPLVKFCYYTLSYMAFLGLFSYTLLVEMAPGTPGIAEYIVYVWFITMMLEELRQLASIGAVDLKNRLTVYFDNAWNYFDTLLNLLMLLGVLLRLLLPVEHFQWARRTYTITLVFGFLRFTQIFLVSKNIGPKVIMIQKMLTDLLFFMLILVVYVLGYGVTVHGLRYPNAPMSWNLLRDVVYQPYFKIYGELFLEDFSGDVPGCTRNRTIWENDPTAIRCSEESWLAIMLFGVYMILTNVLLLNLLIAMFSYTFEKVQDNSEKVWRFYRYALVYEYFDKPTCAPPLFIFNLIFRVARHVYFKCRRINKHNNDFFEVLKCSDDAQLTAFEKAGMEGYLHRCHMDDLELIGTKVSTTGHRIEKVMDDLGSIKEQMTFNHGPDDSRIVQPHRLEEHGEDMAIYRRLGMLESELRGNKSKLDAVLQLLSERLPGATASKLAVAIPNKLPGTGSTRT